MISPAVHFPRVPIDPADEPRVLLGRGRTSALGRDCFLPTDSIIQAAGFLSEMSAKVIDLKIKSQFSGGNSAVASLRSMSGFAGGEGDSASAFGGEPSPRSTVSTPRSESLTPSASAPFPAGNLATKQPSEAPPRGSNNIMNPVAFVPSSVDMSGDAVVGSALVNQPTDSVRFDDIFAGFGQKPVVPSDAGAQKSVTRTNTLRSEVTASLLDEIAAVYRGGKIDKFDCFCLLAVSLGNDHYQEGTISIDFQDRLVQLGSNVIHPTVLPKAMPGTSDSKSIQLVVPTTKRTMSAVKFSYVPTWRPVLFQVKTTTTWSEAVATVQLRIVVNPNFKQYPIENFTVSMSLAGLIAPSSSAPVGIKRAQLKPQGSFNSSSGIAMWTSSNFNPSRQTQLQMEAVLECRVEPGLTDSPTSEEVEAHANQQLPVILKGKYTMTLLSSVDVSVSSVFYDESNVCRDFDLNVFKSKASKFEYRFL